MKTTFFLNEICVIVLASGLSLNAGLFAQNCEIPGGTTWLGFYNKNELFQTAERTPPGIESNFREVIWPRLSDNERSALRGVKFNYPDECGSHPINFFANHGDGKSTVCLPISSLRFLSEVCLAQAYLDVQQKKGAIADNGMMFITNYLSIIRWQWDKIKGTKNYSLLSVLGVNRDQILKDKEVDSRFVKLYSTAIMFIIGHELGHIRYHHKGYAESTPVQSQANEAQADEFSLEILRRIGDPPFGGILIFFFVSQHFTNVSRDNSKANLTLTHPLNSKRIRLVAASLRRHSTRYANSQDNPQRATLQFQSIADQLMYIADTFDDPDIWEIARVNGISGSLAQLKESIASGRDGRSGIRSSASLPPTGSATSPFVGSWSGYWLNHQKKRMPMTITFFKSGSQTKGKGQMNDLMDWQITNAEIKGRTMYFFWTMGDNYFGRGELSTEPQGKKLTGWWGTESNNTIKKSGLLVFERSE